MQQPSKDNESLLKLIYHSAMALQYGEDFARECKMTARHQANNWVSKLKFLQSDIYSALTPASREIFMQEIKKGDILFLGSVAEKWLRLDDSQKDILETMMIAMLKGETVTFEKTEEVV